MSFFSRHFTGRRLTQTDRCGDVCFLPLVYNSLEIMHLWYFITGDNRETTILFQRMSMILQRGNAISYLDTSLTNKSPLQLLQVSSPCLSSFLHADIELVGLWANTILLLLLMMMMLLMLMVIMMITRQHNYRTVDRAMRPIYGCPEKFSEFSLRTRLFFQKFVMDFCSDRC